MFERQRPVFEENALVSVAPWRPILGIAVFEHTLPALQSALGLTLPSTPRRMRAGGADYVWAGPRNWLALFDEEAAAARVAAAAAPFAGVTIQSDGRVILLVHGPHARRSLAKLVPIDLHASVFAEDATALTLAGHIGIQIWREDELFHLACLSSYAESLFHDLLQASQADPAPAAANHT